VVARRAYGSGSLNSKQLAAGQEVWVGQWYDATGGRVKRTVGQKRAASTHEGLTKAQAERELRRLIDAHLPVERIATTQVYMDYQPSDHDAVLIERAFWLGSARSRPRLYSRLHSEQN